MSGETPRLERWLHVILGVGTAVSAVLLGAGLLLELAGFRGGFAAALTNVGLVILMATPLARVVASVAEYTLARDWLFAWLTGTVLAILLGSLVVAFG
jgi:uncharacterized membrane protein